MFAANTHPLLTSIYIKHADTSLGRLSRMLSQLLKFAHEIGDVLIKKELNIFSTYSHVSESKQCFSRHFAHFRFLFSCSVVLDFFFIKVGIYFFSLNGGV